MPSGNIHRMISKMLLGEDGKEIHKWIDEPYKWLGSGHRKQRHDLNTVLFLGIIKGKKAAVHAASHIIADKTLSKAYNEINKKIKKMSGGLLNF